MTQKELKAAYTEELKKAWNDDKMVKYCSKSTAFVIEHNGALYGIEKPKIETSFCFGYGINGIADTEQERTAKQHGYEITKAVRVGTSATMFREQDVTEYFLTT